MCVCMCVCVCVRVCVCVHLWSLGLLLSVGIEEGKLVMCQNPTSSQLNVCAGRFPHLTFKTGQESVHKLYMYGG